MYPIQRYCSQVPPEVKSRRYDSPRRREQAAATRQAILAAAQQRFEQDGYAATSVAAIAREAGVATKTVYLAFETKAGILRALWNLLLRGDEDDVPVANRRWYAEVLEEPDPERKLRRNARNARIVKTRIAGMLRVIRGAADGDPDVAALWNRIETEFHANQQGVVESLRAAKALRRGLTAERGADILWTLNHPDVWHLLVEVRGWTPEQWERWLAESSQQALLR